MPQACSEKPSASADGVVTVTQCGHGYLKRPTRSRDGKLGGWLSEVREADWIDCPVRMTGRAKTGPILTRAQEVRSGEYGVRVIVVDSDERRADDEAMRRKSMERTQQALLRLEQRVAVGQMRNPKKIAAAARRVLQRHHGDRYYWWSFNHGKFCYFENAQDLERENEKESRYVIVTDGSGPGLGCAVSGGFCYKIPSEWLDFLLFW